MPPVSRHYELCGLRLAVHADGELLMQTPDELLGPYAAAPAGDCHFRIDLLHGEIPPFSGEGAPAPVRTWQGAGPGGVPNVFHHFAAAWRLELPGRVLVEADLAARRATLTVCPGCERYLHHGCLTPVLCEFLYAAGQHVIHAASLACDGRAVLLAGPSGVGKTTTALALAGEGMTLLADDATFVGPDPAPGGPLGVWGLRRAARVHRVTRQLLPWLDSLPHRPAHEPDEVLIELARLPGTAAPRAVRPGLVVLVRPRNPRAHELADLDPLEALTELTRQNVRAGGAPNYAHARSALGAIAALVRASRCVGLSVGPDLAGLHEAIRERLDRP